MRGRVGLAVRRDGRALLALWLLGVSPFLAGCERHGKEGAEPRPKFALGGPASGATAAAGTGAVEPAIAPVAVPPAAGLAEAPAPSEPPPADDGVGLAVVLASKLNLRRVPAAQPQTVLTTLSCGDIVAIEGRDGDEQAWYKVRADKLQGYSHSAYLAKLGPGAKAPLCQFSYLKGKRKSRPTEADAPLPTAPHVDKEKAAAVAAAPAAPEPVVSPKVIATAAPAAASAQVGAPPAAPTKPVEGDAAGSAGSHTLSPAAPSPAAPSPAAPSPAAAASVSPASPAAPAERAPAARRGPEVIVLAKDSSRARPVEFSHKSHQAQFACFRCHHPVDESEGALRRAGGIGTNMEKRCRSCHTAAGSARVRPTNEDAFHTECRDCHRAAGGHAPTGCRDCHR